MPFPDDKLVADLRTLSHTQLRAVAAYVKKLQSQSYSPQPEESAIDTHFSAPGYQDPPDIYLSLYAADLRIQECDQTTVDVVGASPLDKPFIELIDPEYRQSAERAFAVVRQQKETKNVRLRLLRTNGSSLPITMAARWVDADGHTPALIDVVCRDISYLKRIGNIAIFSEMLSIGIALVDENGRIAFANSFAEKMFGYAQGELEHQPLTQLFAESAASLQAQSDIKAPHDHHPPVAPDRELHGRTKDGSAIELKIGWSSVRVGDNHFAVASITDITARKTIEDALRKHEEQRALMFSEGLLGDFTWDIERDELEAHPTVFKLYGAQPIAGPVPGNWFRSRQHPDDREDTEQKWRAQLAAGGELAAEFRVNGDDGVTRWIDCRGIAVRDEQGIPRQVHGLNINITARKQAELARHESEARAISAEERLRTAVQFSSAAVWRWHADEDVTEWFGPVLELTGKYADELTSFATFKKLIFPADRPPLEEAIAHCYATQSEFRHEFRIVRPGGEVRWLAGRGGVLRDASGNVYGMTGVNFDITDRKAAEEELKRSEREFRELTNVLPQIVFTATAAGVVDYHNERFQQLTGLPPGPEINRGWLELIFEEDRSRTLQVWNDSVASGRPYQAEYHFWDNQRGQYRWYLVRAVPIRDADGAVVRWIGAGTDIHDQKTAAERLENEVQNRTLDLNQSLALLRQREEQLEKSLQEKDAMLREIHHRVKNNLQIVSSLLSMQASNAGDGAAVAPLRDSERRISSMAMIHEQLYGTEDMQTVEFAEHARSLSQSLLASMAQSPLISCRLDLQPVNLTIHQAIPCALILNELLTNAFKYAYPADVGGEITVRLSSEAGMAILTVSDNGIGLPSTVNPFSPKTLGLEIVQVLVDQLEGELIVVGSPGASFTVKFCPQPKESDASSLCSRSARLSRN